MSQEHRSATACIGKMEPFDFLMSMCSKISFARPYSPFLGEGEITHMAEQAERAFDALLCRRLFSLLGIGG